MVPPLESRIQSEILGYLRGRSDVYVLNVPGGSTVPRGTPDLLVCYQGLFVGFEVKRPEGTYGLTEPQQIRFKQIRRAGGVAEVVTSIEDVKRIFRHLAELIADH